MVGYILAVRPEQRLAYSETLHVYGKDRTYVSQRHFDLLVSFQVSSGLYPG